MKLISYTRITSSSKKVIPNSIFVCLKGKKRSGVMFVDEAIKKGATLIIAEESLKLSVPSIKVKNAKAYFQVLLKSYYDIHMEDYTIVGVTGTDGKTTTTKMLYDILKERYKAIYIGTLGILFDGIKIETNNTTPDLEIIYEILYQAKQQKIRYILMEVSSEGLLDQRLLGIRYDIVIFTNLSREHLNTHKTMEKYLETKCILLKLLKKGGIVLTNCEDGYVSTITSKNKIITYGIHKGNMHVLSLRFYEAHTKILYCYQKHIYYLTLPFVGVYNIYNFLAASLAIKCLFRDDIFTYQLKPIPGRYQLFHYQKKKAILDFAHTPNALDNLLRTIKENNDGRILLILGSQGGKDKGKRPLLGYVAEKYADLILLTSEDPKEESTFDIILDIASGINDKSFVSFLQRKKAIDYAFEIQQEGDIIVIVGKGLEEYEEIGNTRYPYSDYLYLLEKINGSSYKELPNT